MNLMENISAVDATIFFHNNKFWMFANIREIEGGPYLDELFLFSADELLTTNWKPHPSNPIVSDVKRSRPAGKLFWHNGSLYRPAQNSSLRYGHSAVIHKIIELNESNYREEPVTAIRPLWDNKVVATHSLSHEGNLTMIDATIKRSRYF
jgi:hypothetical protein